MKNKIRWYATSLLVLAMVAHASVIVYNAALVNETALAYNNTYSLDLQNNGVNALSAQATYSSATLITSSFGDGQQATGGITVLNYAALVAASAVNQITVVSNSGLSGASIVLPGFVFKEGLDWRAVDTSTGTAASIRSALLQVPYLSVSRSGSVVYATATAGAFYNSLQMVSSTPTALTIATPFFTGGQDNASVRIGGVTLLQGRDFTAATSNDATATSIKNAINASSFFNGVMTAGVSGTLITSTSTKNGTRYNFSMVSSIPSALSITGALMTGGTNSATVLGSAAIYVPAHGLSLALPVLYSAPVGVIGGLSDQTTYYAVPIDMNNIKLASSQSNALLGTSIVITSTSTQLIAHLFTLAPLASGGVPSFKWQVSNDNSNWIDLAVSSVTVASYTYPSASTLWSFGYIGTRYLRLNVVAPTSGGLGLNVRVIGTN